MDQKLLTFCGYRGWNQNDLNYCQTSTIRGFDELNKIIMQFSQVNPEVTIHSVSYSHIEMPEPPHLVAATVLYTGVFTEIPKLCVPAGHSVDEWKELLARGIETTARFDL
jgi:hypothetical protein